MTMSEEDHELEEDSDEWDGDFDEEGWEEDLDEDGF